jgi:hypothetical protein
VSVSQFDPFPNEKVYDKRYINKEKFMFHTDPVKSGKLILAVENQEKDEVCKHDPLDIRRIDHARKVERANARKGLQKKNVLNSEDYIYVAFSSIKGCKIQVKLRIIGDFKKELIDSQMEKKER